MFFVSKSTKGILKPFKELFSFFAVGSTLVLFNNVGISSPEYLSDPSLRSLCFPSSFYNQALWCIFIYFFNFIQCYLFLWKTIVYFCFYLRSVNVAMDIYFLAQDLETRC